LKNIAYLFFFNPFFAFISAVRNYGYVSSKNIVWMYVVFFGYTMDKPHEKDSSRYVDRLVYLHNSPQSFELFQLTLFDEESGQIDIYQPLLTYVVSLFTENGDILFAVFGLFFGFFYSRNIWFLFEDLKDKPDRNLWLLLLTFLSVLGFWTLDGVRMWTAAQMFFYGAYQFYIRGKKWHVITVFLTCLVHFSFVLPIGLFLGFLGIRYIRKYLYYAYLGSFFVTQINLGFVQNLVKTYMPEFIAPKVSTYVSDEYAESYSEGASSYVWYMQFYRTSINWFLFVLVTYIFFKHYKKMEKNDRMVTLFSFSMFYISVANIVALIPSGGRFLYIGQMFAIGFIFAFYAKYADREIKKFTKTFIPLLVFFVIISVRVCFDSLTVGSVVMNPVMMFFGNVTIPLISFLK